MGGWSVGGHTCHLHSMLGRISVSMSNAVHSWLEGQSRWTLFNSCWRAQKRHRRCLCSFTAFGVHRLRCRWHDSMKSSFNSSVLHPTSIHPPLCRCHKRPSSALCKPSLLPPSRESSHQLTGTHGLRTLFPCLQTVGGEAAKATTAHEFGDVMRCFVSKLITRMEDEGMRWLPIWSFDHARTHDCWHGGKAEGIPSAEWCSRLPLPVHCPDFQQVIEHTFGRFKRILHDFIYCVCASTGSPTISPEVLRSLCVQALLEATKKESINADVEKLPITLNMVAHDKGYLFQAVKNGRLRTFEGTGGDWPPKSYR